ncbi:hypothetical protein PV326_010300 [Microctonus aethiopoides]|uniref:5-hydroxyisourate hydrolase n=1 Tax=Microctonus aethiopoides TaxID=144406 RepID=A0AA39FY03_9HYME|nr:hypothetical protein PV326_010300 [Microctonus aethiopoides]KAK0177915.1 hypothetical protein PV328_001913 [Microctonus aethiopoides]
MELQPHISTHVLDTSRGVPVKNLPVSLYKASDNTNNSWILLSESFTSTNGRCANLLETTSQILTVGRYKIVFNVESYFISMKTPALYPLIEIIIDIKNSLENYHLPLLLNPFGFSTYRGT